VSWTEIPLQEDQQVGAELSSTAESTVIEAPENGFGAMVVWCAGPELAFRLRGTDASQRVTVICTYSDGRQRRTSRPFTDADQAVVEEDINEYLKAAGIPPRPPGFRWFIRVPGANHEGGGFWRRLNAGLDREAPAAPDPAENRRAIEAVLPTILASPRLDP